MSSTNTLMASSAVTVVLMLVAVALVPVATGYVITVDAHAEECFFDRIEAGTKSGVTFETIEGGFLDIDITIHDPDRNNIYTGDHETSGKYAFTAHKSGIYTFCFSNKMSTITPKMVMFNIDIGPAPTGTVGAVNEPEANHTKLEEMIRDLAGTLTGVKHEQEYMSVRDKIHRAINEATNSRVMLWSIFEALILVAMSVGQVYYLKRFFEVRRVV